MHELVTLDQFNWVILLITLAGLPVGAALGGLGAAVRRERRALWQGLALGLLGPLAGLAWVVFRWTVRMDPATHYVGLYRPGVLAVEVVVFVAAGVGLGLLYRRVFSPQEERQDGNGNDAAV